MPLFLRFSTKKFFSSPSLFSLSLSISVLVFFFFLCFLVFVLFFYFFFVLFFFNGVLGLSHISFFGDLFFDYYIKKIDSN
jgi:hypothetical protein